MQSFVKMSKLTDIVGRADYISNEKRQEHIVIERSYADWKPYQEYERTHQKTNIANNEGRELIIALPNEWYNISEMELTYRMNMLAQKILPKKYEYQWAVHWNKSATNLHVHLIFSERSREYGTSGTWDRDIYLTNDGKVARRKADRAVDEKGNVKPPVHRKGEPKSDGKYHFTTKDTRYKSEKWLEQVKQDVIEFYKEYGVSIDNRGLLHQYHEGKGSESATIHAKNEQISLANEIFRVGQSMGMVFPERSSQQFRRMLAEVLNPLSPVSFHTLTKHALKSPKIYPVMCPRQKAVDFVCSKLKESNTPFWLEKNEDSNMYTIFVSASECEYIKNLFNESVKHSTAEPAKVPDVVDKTVKTIQEQPQQPLQAVAPKTDIEMIVNLKHDYVRQCCILHYLKSCHTSCNAQNMHINAQNTIQVFKKCSLALINANDEYKRTFNPFKKAKFRKKLDEAINDYEKAVDKLNNVLSLSVSYSLNAFGSEYIDKVLAKTIVPLDRLKKAAENEIANNEYIDKLNGLSITDTSVGSALRAFQTACDNVPECNRQEVYTALKKTVTPLLPFESTEFSRGRQTSGANVDDVLKKLAPSSVPQRENVQEHTLSRRRGMSR